MLIWKPVFVHVWCLNSRKGCGEIHREQVWRVSPGAGAAPEWHNVSVLKLGCLLSLFQKKLALSKTFFSPVFPSAQNLSVSEVNTLEDRFLLLTEGGTIVSGHLNPLSSYWFWFICFFLTKNIHEYFLLRSSRNFLRGIRSDKALNIPAFLMAEALTACLSNSGLAFSSSLLLIFFMKAHFPSFYGDSAISLVFRKGRMRKVTTVRGRGEAFNDLLQLFVVWLLEGSRGVLTALQGGPA